MDTKKQNKTHKLNQWVATAICGNDITSSCLYVAPLSIMYAGKWAWLSLLMVSVTLYFFRDTYNEVVGALPLNGGAYNALLNTTSKRVASIAASFTLLSYMATAVISAFESMSYLSPLLNGINVMIATIILLGIFAILTIIGIGESSKVAAGIFIFHLLTLGILIVASIYVLTQVGLNTLITNFEMPTQGSFPRALFFGFCAAMLGISGFESSANFVEEQAPGVFPKTLRNMWIAVTIINPTIAILALSMVHIDVVQNHQETLLSYMGQIAGGTWLSTLISVDATLVLSGAVLTSFVGVTGLVHRMVLDRGLPQLLLKSNKRGTQHRIIITFYLLCVSVLLATKGHLTSLANVYAISFLSVMALYGIGNLLLKVKRDSLKRDIKASWLGVIFAITSVIAALIGTIIKSPSDVLIFFEYFVIVVTSVLLMLNSITLFNGLLFIVEGISSKINSVTENMHQSIEDSIDKINSLQVVFFTRGKDVANIKLALDYVEHNEHTNKVKIVTVIHDDNDIPETLRSDIEVIDREFPKIDIELNIIKGDFSPDLIQELSEKWNIPKNFMFIGCPNGALSTYELSEYGGVRLIA